MQSLTANPYIFYAAIVTAFGSMIALVANIILSEYTKRRQKIWENTLSRCDEQIGKFYAPLLNLVEQLDITDELKKTMVSQDEIHASEISKLCYDNYFVPIHDKIARVMESNLHLIEGKNIPQSFIDYYKHVASERVFFSLVANLEQAKKQGLLPEDAAKVHCVPFSYPEPNFKNDIRSGFDAVLNRQEKILDLLKITQPLSLTRALS